MKLKNISKIVILISLFIVGTTTIQSQTVTIGNGTSANDNNTWPAPYGNYEYGTRYQIIIDASELTDAGAAQGNITAIAFDVSEVNSCALLNNFSVKIGNCPNPNFETSASWVTGLTEVYLSSYQPTTGWNNHNFSNAFYWNGTSDIVIETCFYNGTYSYNASTRNTATSQKMVIGSEGSFDPCSNTTTPYTYSERPNIRLSMQTNTGINDINSKISVYPNPAKKKIRINLSDNSDRIEQLSIFNSIGQIVYMNKGKNINNKTIAIGLSDFYPGLYFILLKTENETLRKRFIITK
ncbi:MAG: T9SS type A sorting domain-containing protein [Bacteroidales bacterium]|nr:T9SS type A sorting domain-containing protein [Bacteroidales bacterium]